ncbi:hypothetical protein WJU23_00385 [Prosthecobacter sp. SYSU 5D2]|uniref:hypothetical protein n=1 Tax=Prosthecobacter sp. SYSU 5D2 TaxID=3134134 RepID=UPI0031FEEE75
MKTSILLATFLAATLALPVQAALPAGAAANFSLALTLKTILPGTFVRDADGKFIKGDDNQRIPTGGNTWQIVKGDKETSYSEVNIKTASAKYGIKELLLDLKDAGILDDSTIAGWSVKAITVGTSSDISFFLVKKGKPSEDITDHLDFDNFNYDEGEPSASSFSLNQLITQVNVDEELQSLKYKYLSTTETLTGFSINIDGIGGKLYGLVNLSQKVAVIKPALIILLSNASMPVMAGAFDTAEDDDILAKGSIKISGAKVVADLSTVLGDL